MYRLILLGLLLAVAAEGYAQQGPYVGAGVGQGRVEVKPFDARDTGFQLFGGYRFREEGLPLKGTLGIEAGYADLGAPRDRVLAQDVEVAVDAFKIYATASRRFGERWSVLGKLGVVAWDEAVSASAFSGSNDGSDLAAGIGVAFRTSNQALSVRGEIEGFNFLDGVWLWSVSVVYTFGGSH